MEQMDQISYFIITATAGHDTTSATISGGMKALLEHPDQLAKLRDNPSLAKQAAREMIRWTSPVRHMMRTTTKDIVLRGKTRKAGDVETVGRVFREDGIGLRDDYKISGPELETMCDLARAVPGVLGERMLGGGDKGAAGALVLTDSVEALETAVRTGYPRSHPDYADAFAVHVCRVVDGITTLVEKL